MKYLGLALILLTCSVWIPSSEAGRNGIALDLEMRKMADRHRRQILVLEPFYIGMTKEVAETRVGPIREAQEKTRLRAMSEMLWHAKMSYYLTHGTGGN